MKTSDLLLESIDIEIKVDISDYVEYAKKHILELYEYSAKRTGTKISSEDVAEASMFIKKITDETKENAYKISQKIRQQIPKIETQWTGSTIFIKPWFNKDFNFSISNGADDFNISVGKKLSKSNPDFTVFRMGQEIDDILDVGDKDFFVDPATENDYFLLVNVLSSGSVWDDPERGLVLYTARPKSDRSHYDNTETVPKGVFLTTSPDEAEGYARDFGDRDLYKVKIQQKWLSKTLDRNSVKNYQTTKDAPVVWIERLTEHKVKTLKETYSYPQPSYSPLSGQIKYTKPAKKDYFIGYYKTTDDEIADNMDNVFETKKGVFGEGIYWSGVANTGHDPLNVYYIQVKIELDNPLIIEGGVRKEEAVLEFEKTDKSGYDGVIWIDNLNKIRGGVVYNKEKVSYYKNENVHY